MPETTGGNVVTCHHDDEALIFAEEEPQFYPPVPDQASWKIMIVDDEVAVHRVTQMALSDLYFEGHSLQFLSAYSGQEALLLLEEHPDTALVLLDVVMETDHAGLEVVHSIRKQLRNPFVRIILRTGQPGQAPEKKVVMEYDINDYKLKSMLTEQGLFTAVISALRTYRDLRTIEENRIALQTAMEQAQAANRAKIQFLSNMGHELRTPLHGIIGFTDLLLRTELTEKQRKYLHTIKKSGTSLSEIINNLLDLTELEEGALHLQETNFSLRDTVEEVMKLIRIQAEWKNLSVAHQIDEDVPDQLFGDNARLKQVLMNLMINAVKHTQTGRISLSISRFQGEARHLLFVVDDTGVGIAKEKHDRIFQAFEVGEDVLTKRFAGAGLGLTISKELVEKMDGKIWMESELHQGSTFYFSLKFKQPLTTPGGGNVTR